MWTRDPGQHFFRRLRELGLTLAFQTSLQGIALATGLVIIHAISKEEYGLYAIVASVQGMATVLSDSGISTAVTSLLGRTWADPGANLGVILTSLRERRRLLAGVLPLCVAMMLVIALGKTSMVSLAIMGLTMVICVYLDVGTHLYQVVPLYTGKRNALQTQQMMLGAARILAVVALALIHQAHLYALLVINVIFSFAGLFFARKLVVGNDPPKPVFDPKLRREIHRIVLRLLPNAAFYAFQGQITTYIISLFGKLTDVASVAALGRLGMIFSVLLNMIAILGAPAFSKAQTKPEALRIFWLVVGSVALFSLAFYVMSLFIPGLMLFMLGKNYASLSVELQITVITAGLTSLSSVIWSLLSSRGFVGLVWLYILVTCVVQIAYGVLGGDLHTVRGVLWFGAATAGASLLNGAFLAYWSILRPKELGRNQ